jgi:Fe-S cluster assembly iron-binding protein IscA
MKIILSDHSVQKQKQKNKQTNKNLVLNIILAETGCHHLSPYFKQKQKIISLLFIKNLLTIFFNSFYLHFKKLNDSILNGPASMLIIFPYLAAVP